MSSVAFWNKLAPKYFKSKVRNEAAYAATLARVGEFLTSDTAVLEVGCGTGTSALKLAPSAKTYIATDYSDAMLRFGRERMTDEHANLTFQQAALGENELPTGPFDVIFASSILHLVHDLPKVLSELHACLKPGGVLLTKTVCLGKLWYLRPVIGAMQLLGKAPYVNYLKPDDLLRTITAAGFEIEETRHFEGKETVPFFVARKPV